jgi:preprotein translocase subunit YajC
MNLSILLQATGGEPNPLMSFLPIILIIAVFYFLMILPQKKQRKKIEAQRAAMKVGDKIITSGGVYGKLKEINDTNFVIEIADGVKIKIDKNSVFAVADETQTGR